MDEQYSMGEIESVTRHRGDRNRWLYHGRCRNVGLVRISRAEFDELLAVDVPEYKWSGWQRWRFPHGHEVQAGDESVRASVRLTVRKGKEEARSEKKAAHGEFRAFAVQLYFACVIGAQNLDVNAGGVNPPARWSRRRARSLFEALPSSMQKRWIAYARSVDEAP